jgi:hypothetical protein
VRRVRVEDALRPILATFAGDSEIEAGSFKKNG